MSKDPSGGCGITCQQRHVVAPQTPLPQPAQPRAEGRVGIGAKRVATGSVLSTLHQSGAFKALFPRRSGPTLSAILVNTAGGITGGDRFATTLDVGPQSALSVTTQACERAYRAQPDEVGMVRNRAQVAAGGRLDWVPQETILYNGAALHRHLRIDLAADARLLMVEPLIFGRALMGETLTDLRFRDRIEITRDGAPLYTDALALTGNAAAHLARPAVARGAGAMVSIVHVAPGAEAHLRPLRALLAEAGAEPDARSDAAPASGGVSLIGPDVLALRLLAPDGFCLRQRLIPILIRLTDDTLPRSWMT